MNYISMERKLPILQNDTKMKSISPKGFFYTFFMTCIYECYYYAKINCLEIPSWFSMGIFPYLETVAAASLEPSSSGHWLTGFLENSIHERMSLSFLSQNDICLVFSCSSSSGSLSFLCGFIQASDHLSIFIIRHICIKERHSKNCHSLMNLYFLKPPSLLQLPVPPRLSPFVPQSCQA